jgi:flagellar export protein FliJ
MSDLSVLIRLHKHELDEKRRALAQLYAALAALERERRALERLYELERQAVDASGDVHFTFASYTEKVKKKRAELDNAENALEKQITGAKDSLMETFAEMKKYEMTQEERDRIEEEERAFREGREMDEIGIEGFRRKGEE